MVERFENSDNRELKHARFRHADGNRKRSFHLLGLYCLPNFILLISNGEKILSSVNVVVAHFRLRRNVNKLLYG